MARRSWLVFALGLLTILLHFPPRDRFPGMFGLDALLYLPGRFRLVWIIFAVFLILPPVAKRLLPGETSAPPVSSPRRSRSIILAGLIVFAGVIFFRLLPAATPLLGDGLDRLEALPRGFPALRGQPAPLDILLHLLFYQALGPLLAKTPFLASWQTYRILSTYLAGTLALLSWWAWARRSNRSPWDQALVFGGLLGMGTTLLFCGYPENYSLLAAMLFVHLWLLDRSLEPNRSPLWTLLSLLILISLHFFALLLLPPTLFVLYRFGRWRPGRKTFAALAGAGLIFMAFLILMLERHYRGTAAIFLAPGQIFSLSRLLEFLNQQLLVCPALFPLLALAFPKSPTASRPIEGYLLGATLIWLAFFYVLRPVLGAGPDWDLFSLPALVYTPWLLLRARDNISPKPEAHYLVWTVLVVSFFHTIPWIAVNARPEAAAARYENLMTDLEGKTPWAAGYGWLKLGKYRQRLGMTDLALAAYDRSIAANPGYSVLYREVGQKMIELSRFDLAVARFEGFLQHNPTNPGARPALAQARKLYAENLEWQGRFQEAAAQYQAILELFPDNSEAKTALARVRVKIQAPAGN